ncbi:TRAP transporter large permease subunit [Pontibacterium sp. N1Y112]|jgi:tripartite ATP-independent transporter DctM subunit|uniref:TRAP transporter large permease protein n=1 Tax=Pontibacterium sinense TaxID=2781979 RepID=A0A8J7FB82_9GAMM|nr:TRAP transporter large permease subunit [Pontibacterium sinense]MBE9398365.1 TRAP transporter large permease subunit [Pontibacterium sinense]
MDISLVSFILVVCMLLMLTSGVWVALTLTGISIIGLQLIGNDSIGLLLGTSSWSAVTGWSLTALPLFIWMGEILFRTRLSQDLFEGLAPILSRFPGKLLHVNILSCGIFAAVSGSSAATAATIGRMTLPELSRRGYSESMAIGTLAGSGTLGLLIPPSIILIVYGVSAEVSIARLFLAGVLPGLVLILLFMAFTAGWTLMQGRKGEVADNVQYSTKEKIQALKKLIPIILLIGGVLGSIYQGIATPTEAAAFGVAGSFLLSFVLGSFTLSGFIDSVAGAVKNSCMLGLILVGAHFLTLAMGFIGIPSALATWISELGLSPIELILYLTVFFVIMGCFLDGISVIVLTTSVVLPMVTQANIDLLWFGIFLVLVVEMSQITPPVGFNLFVIQALTGKSIIYVAKAALPFFFMIAIAIVLITAYPSIVLYLPTLMTS